MTPKEVDITKERILRLEIAVVEIQKIMLWLAGDNTWQSIWEPLDEIISEIKSEIESDKASEDET